MTINRPGHTLIELVAAMVASSFLLVGLGSVMLIGRQIAYAPSASADRIEASRVVHSMADELRFATMIVDSSTSALEFVVADRNGDGAAERIRYEWSGTPGDPLTRSYNGAAAVAIADSVQSFLCPLVLDTTTTTFTTTTDSSESLLVGNGNSPGATTRSINTASFSSQQIGASSILSGAPAGAVSWNATKVEFVCSRSVLPNETLRVQIQRGGVPNNWPSGEVIGEIAIPEANFGNSAAWYTATFPSPIRGLDIHRTYAIVWRGTTGDANNACLLNTDDNAVTGVCESEDGGASWSYMPSRQTFYRVYGTYTSQGSSHDVDRNYATQASILLQMADQSHSRLDASVPLVNRPELLSAYWRADFTTDPTAEDSNGDSSADWETASGDSFDTDSLSGGVWTADDALETRPRNDFNHTAIVEVRCRNTTVGGQGAVVRINADHGGGLHSPIVVSLALASDGTQTLTLNGKSSDASDVQLFQRTGLTSDFVKFCLTILPDNDLVNLSIEDKDQGTFSYPKYSRPFDNRFLTLYADTSSAEFDYAELRVVE